MFRTAWPEDGFFGRITPLSIGRQRLHLEMAEVQIGRLNHQLGLHLSSGDHLTPFCPRCQPLLKERIFYRDQKRGASLALLDHGILPVDASFGFAYEVQGRQRE